MSTYLAPILDAHRRAARPVDGVLEAAVRQAGPVRDVLGALSSPGLAVIAEVKRASPSKGPLDLDLDPAEVARDYEAGGAAMVSVLTDEAFFAGSAEDLRAARAAVSLPVLRKDFTVSPRDLYEARVMGADACLLIVAALSRRELGELFGLASSLGLVPLVEVHDEAELDVAGELGAPLIGVNQRDLSSFEVDPSRAARLRPRFPSGALAVAESGIQGRADAECLADAGYDAILVGESVVTAPDRRRAVRDLAGLGARPGLEVQSGGWHGTGGRL